MVDEKVVSPPEGSLSKLAAKFDEMANKIDNELVLKLSTAKVKPSRVNNSKEFQDRFNERNSAFKTKMEKLRDDLRDIARQLRKVEKSYKDVEFDNKDDIERLRDMIDNLKSRNPGIEKVMPTVPNITTED